MVELFDMDKREQNRQSSKGNQLKFYRDGWWYKVDYMGYEGLAEYVVSKLLGFSNLTADEYVDYELEQISYNGNTYNGCKSKDFSDGWNLITVERLFMQSYGRSLYKSMYEMKDEKERLKMMVSNIERITGISDFGGYMSKMLAADALFINEDRHTHNIAVMTNDKKEYKTAPIFDNGAGLLSDTTMEYSLEQDHLLMLDNVRAKTFCDDFVKQLDSAEQLYGKKIVFNYGFNEVKNIVDKYDIYNEQIKKRVVDVVMQLRHKYEYMFE